MLTNNTVFKAITIVMALLFSASAICQTSGLGTWNAVNAKFTFNSKWSAFVEAQVRSQKMYHDFSYHEYKGGVGFNFKKQMAVVLAMGQYVVYTPTGDFESPVTSSEFRIWQQLTLNNNVDRFKIEHRFRTEQRFLSIGYRNRFRYRANLIVPINKTAIENNTFYLSAADEVFLTDLEPYFLTNRAFYGGGYQFSKLFTLQIGVLHQFDYRFNNASTSKSYLQTTLLFSLNEDRSKRERHPSSMD